MNALRSASFLLLASAPAAAQTPFATWSGYDASRQDQARMPYASALADLDGDGDLDAAFAHHGSAVITVARNLGGGRFAQPEAYPIATPSRCVVAADFDGDGRLDLAAGDYGNSGEGRLVSLLRNTGAGFASAVHYATGAGSNLGPAGLAAADFDGDGRVDLAVANHGTVGQGTTVALLRNDGAGGLLPAIAFPAGTGPWKLAAGDLDGDGDPDLAIAQTNRRVAILRNTGGAFAAPVQMPALMQGTSTDAYRQIQLADVDRDGDLDALYASNGMWGAGGVAVALLRNAGNGTFGAAEEVRLDGFSSSPTDLGVGDVTGDSWVDVLVAEHLGWTLVPSNGAGGFLPARPYFGGQGPIAIAAADMDGDGDLEPVVTARDSLEMTVHWNDGAGNVPVPPSYAAGSLSNSLAWGDVDHDGDLDVAASYGTTGAGGIVLLRNDGAGHFASQTLAGPRAAMRVKMRDLNGDGWLDLLWADSTSQYDFVTRMNLGNGTFGAATTWFVHTCGNGDVDAVDLDNDGDLDVVLTEYLGCPSVPLPRTFLNRNRGDGTFEPATVLDTYLRCEIVGHGDLNADGNQDLVLTSDGVEVYLGNGDGTFRPRMRFTTDWGPKHMVVADLSGDGVLDLATYNFGDTVGGSGGESMSVLLGHGDGTFGPHTNYYASFSPDLGNPEGLRAVDHDGDGDLDLFGGNYGSGDVSLYVNHGDGTFEPQRRYGAGMHTHDFAVADFTGDGRVDVAALVGVPPSGIGNALAILEGRDAASAIEPNCFGDGSGAACPCGNASAPGSASGCLHSLGSGGRLTASGAASLANDTLVLFGASMPNSSALYFQGTGELAGGAGAPFGDGLRCAGGTTVRLGTKSNSGGASAFPGVGDPSVSARGQVAAPGTRTYQVWFRNAASFCTPSTFNLTNALRVAWSS